MTNLFCTNDGNDYILRSSEKQRQCWDEKEEQIMSYKQKAQFEIAKRIVVKMIENEKFEWKMTADDCKYVTRLEPSANIDL